MDIAFSPEEMARYARHIILPNFGEEGQRKLKAASVLVVGAGGLGSPLLLYLAAAGVGRIGVVDFDTVDASNLQRQVLFTVDDVGKSKAETARRRLLALNPHIEIIVHNTQLTSDNALEIIKNYEVVADGTDNFPTRYLVNDACVIAKKTNVHASISRFEGRVAVFNHGLEDGSRSPNYRDLFPEPPPHGAVPNCAEGGVLGVLPGIIGSMQAAEVIKVITGLGEALVGKMFLFNALTFETKILKFKKTNIEIKKLIDYHEFCGILNNKTPPIQEITPKEFYSWKRRGIDYQLIDVREPDEYAAAHIYGELIPLGQAEESVHLISKNKKVVVHCRSGQRSATAIRKWQSLYPFNNLYNLRGGLLAYWQEIEN